MVEFDSDVAWGRAGWVAFGAVLGLVFLWVLYSFVGTFVFALFIYYATRWPHARLREHVGPPSVAAGASLVLVGLPIITLLTYATAIGLQELRQFSSTAEVGPYLDFVGPYANVTSVVGDPASFARDPNLVGLVRTSLTSAVDYVGVVGTGLVHLFVMFAVAYYLLKDGRKVERWAGRFDDEYPNLRAYGEAVDASLERIFAGNLANAFATGIIGAIAYSLLELFATPAVSIPYPALTGLLAGLASLIPIVGMKIVYVPVSGYLGYLAFTSESGWEFFGAFVLVSVVVVDLVPDLFVRPRVSRSGWQGVFDRENETGDGYQLHVGLLMMAYVLGPFLFGWYGIFLAPVILVLVVHFVRLVLPELLVKRSVRPDVLDPETLTADEDGGTREGGSESGSGSGTGEESAPPGDGAGSGDAAPRSGEAADRPGTGSDASPDGGSRGED